MDHLILAAGILHEISGAPSPLRGHLRTTTIFQLIPESMLVHDGDH
jgi:hypothetical protein